MIVDSVVLVLAMFSDFLTRLGYDPALWWTAHFDPATAHRLFGYRRPRFVSVPARTWQDGRWHRVSVVGVVDEVDRSAVQAVVVPVGDGFKTSQSAVDYLLGIGIGDRQVATAIARFVQYRHRLSNVQVTAWRMDKQLRHAIQTSIRGKVSLLDTVSQSSAPRNVFGVDVPDVRPRLGHSPVLARQLRQGRP